MGHGPFIFESQAKLVYYIEDPVESEWKIVVSTRPRDVFDMGDNVPNETETNYNNESSDPPLDDLFDDAYTNLN